MRLAVIIGFSLCVFSLAGCSSALGSSVPEVRTAVQTTLSPTPKLISSQTLSACKNSNPSIQRHATSRLIYISPTNTIWLWDKGQQPKQLTEFGGVIDLSISKDGKIILFARQFSVDQVELWTISADRTGMRRLLSTVELSKMAGTTRSGVFPFFRSIEWEGNSHTFAFNRWSSLGSSTATPDTFKIWKVNADTRDTFVIGKGSFDYSPNGELVLIYDDYGMGLYDADGDPYGSGKLPKYRAIDEHGRHILIKPSWATDSESFLIALPETSDVYQSGATFNIEQIWIRDQLIEDMGTFQGFALSVNFSPDHKFMFYAKDANLRPAELHLADLQTDEDIIFSRQDDVSFDSWSPNSRDFIFDVEYAIRSGNVCDAQENTKLFPYLNSYAFISWLDNTTS